MKTKRNYGKYWKSLSYSKSHENTCDAASPYLLSGHSEFSDKNYLFGFAALQWFKFHLKRTFFLRSLIVYNISYDFMIFSQISMVRFCLFLCLFLIQMKNFINSIVYHFRCLWPMNFECNILRFFHSKLFSISHKVKRPWELTAFGMWKDVASIKNLSFSALNGSVETNQFFFRLPK